MGIPIEKSFTVQAPSDAVWDFLTDPHRVASCLPGAAITEQVDDTTYAGTITVKAGPVTASYKGKLHFDRLDREAGEAELSGSGQETKGKGGADMRMKSRVVEKGPSETEVVVTSDVNVVGVLAQFGRGMIQDVSDQLFGRFTDCMRAELEGPAEEGAEAEAAPVSEPVPAGEGTGAAVDPERATPSTPGARPATEVPPEKTAEPALDVLALGGGAAGRAALRTLKRPGFWIAVLILALLVYWLFLR